MKRPKHESETRLWSPMDHSRKVQYIVFLWQLYEVCLVQIEEQMGDNPLDIPFEI
jgi:hypothetical protein